MPDLQIIAANGISIRAALAGQGPLIVLIHGFPECWRSWRHQMAPLAAAGFTVCAIDVRGNGGSDKPAAVEAYDMQSMTGDIAGLIDALSPGAPAVLIGHDWGASIAWHTALLHEAKVRAVAGLSVPWAGFHTRPLIDALRDKFTKRGKFFYQVYFQDEGIAEAEFEADLRGALRRFHFALSGEAGPEFHADRPVELNLFANLPDPDPFPAWFPPEEIDYCVAAFARSGLRGPLNRYRNYPRDHVYLAGRNDIVRQPSLFITGERDLVLNGMSAASRAQIAPHLGGSRSSHILSGVGHWVQQEAPGAVNALLIEWLAGL